MDINLSDNIQNVVKKTDESNLVRTAEQHSHKKHHEHRGHHSHHRHHNHKRSSSSVYEQRGENIIYKNMCKEIITMLVKRVLISALVLTFFWLLITAIVNSDEQGSDVSGIFNKEDHEQKIEKLEKKIVDLEEYIYNLEKKLSKYEKVVPYNQERPEEK